MTTSSADPELPADVNDPGAAAPPTEPAEAGQPWSHDGEDGGDGTDPMGIDEDDPIDAALVGSPVDEPEREGATTPAPSGSDAEPSPGPE